MAKRPRKTASKKPAFAPPPPAAGKDSEFSFGEYEQPNTEPDPFGAEELDFDFYSSGWNDPAPKAVHRDLYNDPFATTEVDDFGSPVEITPLIRFERVSRLYLDHCYGGEHDPEKQEILRRIAVYWLGQAEGIWGD